MQLDRTGWRGGGARLQERRDAASDLHAKSGKTNGAEWPNGVPPCRTVARRSVFSPPDETSANATDGAPRLSAACRKHLATIRLGGPSPRSVPFAFQARSPFVRSFVRIRDPSVGKVGKPPALESARVTAIVRRRRCDHRDNSG
jgi:hypothetical protein